MTGRKVLVTGGAGFIGSNVADAFIERGDRVWIVDNLSSGRTANVNPKATFAQVDIRDAALGAKFAGRGENSFLRRELMKRSNRR